MSFSKNIKAFTLLEVLAAILLFSIAVVGIIQGQSNSVRAVVRAENMTQAIALAEQKMTELEIDVQKNSFVEAFNDEESGEFEQEGLEDFRWTIILERVDLGCFIPVPEEGQSAQQGGLLQVVQNFFERSVRKAIVRVEWDEGNQTRSAQLVQLLIRFEGLPQGAL